MFTRVVSNAFDPAMFEALSIIPENIQERAMSADIARVAGLPPTWEGQALQS